jgi:NadR type nicotinamide-nucleotide adenylyltransferase
VEKETEYKNLRIRFTQFLKMVKTIAVTGPESTGKSVLAKQLAEHYQTVWVPEFARSYLENLGRAYTEKDILEIAKGQVRAEETAATSANGFLFCDTELIVTKIWSEVKYRRCDPWIINGVERQSYDLYLLCDIDLPWEYDPLREHPHIRKDLFRLYHKELTVRNFSFAIVRGVGPRRLENAIDAIERFDFDRYER